MNSKRKAKHIQFLNDMKKYNLEYYYKPEGITNNIL